MTDTTDINALRNRAASEVIANKGLISAELAMILINQLEVERQRAESLSKSEWKMAGELSEAQAELAALKGDQVPVVWHDMPFTFEELEQVHGATFANGYVRGWARKCESVTMKGPLFTAPQKPVVLLPPAYEKSADFTEYHQGWNSCRNYMLAETKEAGGTVKDGE